MAVKRVYIDKNIKNAIEDLKREVNLLSSLKHKNIVAYLGC